MRSISFLATGRAALVFFLGTVAGCSSLLPKSKETTGAAGSGWQSYQDAQQAFDRIVPGKTTVAELQEMRLDPRLNPNTTQLPRHELLQRFIVNQSVSMNDLDEGVRDCLQAREQCRALEVNQTASQTKRTGNAALDIAKVYRETHTSGWRFCGLILVKDGVVVYKLTSGQPAIHEIAHNQDVLGPLQALSSKLKLDVNSIASGNAPSEPTVSQPVTGIRKK
ncbi:MAG: hypothetical protein E6H57_17025 [Betaproteobacteria bacterium]|nr:MAG: hypothetical protein E6H57_17025 [Betaproteobacteria bacterium]